MQFRLNLLACLLTLISLSHMRQTKVAQQLLSLLSDNGGISTQGSSLGANLDSSCKDSLSMGVVQSTFAKCTNILFLYSLSRFPGCFVGVIVFYAQVAIAQLQFACNANICVKKGHTMDKKVICFFYVNISKNPTLNPCFFYAKKTPPDQKQKPTRCSAKQ